MKHLIHALTESDIQTFLCTLSVFPTVNLEEISKEQQLINNTSCFSAMKKLTSHNTDFEPNEVRVMAISLVLAGSIIKNEISASDEIKKDLYKYMFSINKLLPVFSSIFD